jgi:Tfp pilus assembly protein PilN
MGPVSYLLVAALAVTLAAVVAVVLTGNQVSDRQAEKAGLESQLAQASAEADRLARFADFAALQQAREQTVTTLAQSRFDWERVLRELAIVIPGDVWLTNLSGTVSPEVSLASGSGSGSTGDAVSGPALSILGCGASHEAVARFASALEDIDGVTRVAVEKSDRPIEAGPGGASGGAGGSASCQTRDFIAQFQIVAGFDGVQLGAATQAPVTPPPTTQTASAADQSQVADGQQQLERQKQSSRQQTDKADRAVDTLVPGTATTP